MTRALPAVLPKHPPEHTLPSGARLVRFYDPAYGPWHQARFVGPRVRFDHHRPAPTGADPERQADPERSVWYAASSLLGAVAERYGDSGFVDRGARQRICVARVHAPLRLINLVGPGARRFGLDQRIATSRDYLETQEWARAFYESYPWMQGIRWRGRQSGSICYVLNDRTDLKSFHLVADGDIGSPGIWPWIVRAGRNCRIRALAS